MTTPDIPPLQQLLEQGQQLARQFGHVPGGALSPEQLRALLHIEYPASSDDVLQRLAAEYHERTEAFDRTVCTGPIGPDGGILPATPRQMGAINFHAVTVMADLRHRAARLGIEQAELQRAISHYREGR